MALSSQAISSVLIWKLIKPHNEPLFPRRASLTLGTNLTISRTRCCSLDPEATRFVAGKKFQLDDVIEAQQFDRGILNEIFKVPREIEAVEKNSAGGSLLRGFLMATLFYESSTRTRLSFEYAMKRLGDKVLTTENVREFSSAVKGETLEGECQGGFTVLGDF